MDELIKDIIRLAPEFGITLKEDSNDVEGEVADKLKRAAKIDEVDTITFGLETDDGKIVKVFVNAEDAEKFEKLMADMLGEEDNIEDALNRVANEVDIVDVEWPAEEEDDGDADEVDDDLDDDGSDVLDKKVYNKANLGKEVDGGTKPAVEHMTFGERFAAKQIDEHASTSYVGTRMRTPSQQLVYQAVLDLGVPEMVLDRSPYRAQVVKNLKDMALDLQQNGSMKNALKLFVKRAIAGLEKEEQEDRKKAQQKAKAKGKFGTDKSEEQPVDESLLLEMGPAILFWGTIERLLIAAAGSAAESLVKDLLATTAWKGLVNRSGTAIASKLQGTLTTKFQQLKSALGMSTAAKEDTPVEEALNPADVQAFIIKLINFADSSDDKSAAKRVLATTQLKQVLNKVKATAGSIPSSVKSKMVDINKMLASSEMVGEAEEAVDLQGQGPAKTDNVKWQVEPSKGGVLFKAEDGSAEYEVVDEDAERMVKALSNRESITVRSVQGPKLVVSPRGRAAVIKVIGSSTRIELNAPDVDAVIDAAATMMEAKRLAEGTEVRVPTTAAQWEFYTSEPEAEAAAKILGKILVIKLTDVLSQNLKDEKELLKQAKRVRDEMYKEMSKYSRLGARDTEPESHLVDCIERELKLPKYSLER